MERWLDQGRASGAAHRARRGAAGALRLAVGLAAALALAACAGSIGEEPLIASPPVETLPAGAGPAETRGPEHARLIAAYGGVYDEPRVTAMVDSLVERLQAASAEPVAGLRVTVLNSPAVNAFALPSGDLYLTRGLIALANDESELAAVIAHEIAHITTDHAALRQRQAEAAALAKRVSEVMEDPTIRTESLATAELSLAEFSQQQELEADEKGVATLAAAGFDPFAAARFLQSMARHAALPAINAASAQKPGFLSTHPTTPERVEHARRVARGYGAPGIGRTARSTYLRAIDGMLYGDDPREGFVRGREFAHVDLAIAFEVPEGYVLKNTSEAVLATDGEHTAIRFDAVRVPDSEPLSDYLSSGWVKGLVTASIRAERINGLDAAVAAALVEGWSFRVAVIRGPRAAYRFIFASARPAATYEAAFRDTLASFRLLSPADRAGMRPLRIETVPVRANQTMATLAARMDGMEPQMRLPLFEALNGLAPGERLVPGELAKIVSE